MIYAKGLTLFVNNNSFRILKVPVEVREIVPLPPTTTAIAKSINSPIVRMGDGKTTYLSNDKVSWAYLSNVTWNMEIAFLESFGLQWERDMAGLFYSDNQWIWIQKVKWLRMFKSNRDFATIMVENKKLYNGINLKVIVHRKK